MSFITIKNFSFLAFALFLFMACDSSKELKKNNLTQLRMEMTTRGNATSLSMTKNKTLVNSRVSGENINQKQTDNRTTTSETWKKMQKLVSQMDLNQMENWTAPSQDFMFDGKRGTVIYIDVNGKTISSQTFDEGNPPSELQDLYDALIEETN